MATDRSLGDYTIPRFFRETVKNHGPVVALHDPHGKPPESLTYAQLNDAVHWFGAGLADCGVQAGDRIAVFSDNRPRWMIADLAILCMGAINVPRGADTSAAEFEFILDHSGATAAVLQDKKLFARLLESTALDKLRLVVLLDDSSAECQAKARDGLLIVDFSAVSEKGKGRETEYAKLADAVKPNTIATIVYTSGTTGSPKGVMLSHANLAHMPQAVDLGAKPRQGEIQLAILPTWHAYERACEYYGMKHGTTLTYTDKRYFRKDFEQHQPMLFPCVPRIWESIHDAIQDKVSKSPPGRQKLFNFFVRTGMAYVRARRRAFGLDLRKESLNPAARALAFAKLAAIAPIQKIGDIMIFSKLRAVTGGRMRAAVSGGGSLPVYLDDFFEIVGIPILNGYGLTETAPVLTVRRTNHNVRGSVGLPIPGTEIVIRDEQGKEVPQGTAGVIFAKGPQIMQGYYKNAEATEKVLSPDGWFNTGDLGWIACTGDLTISGRAKDTIVLASGENVEPEPIEDAIRKSLLINQVVVVGQDQKYVAALVVPNWSTLAEALGLPSDTASGELSKRPEANKAVREAINASMAAAKTFKPSDQIQKITLLEEPFTEQNGMLTATFKIKRNVVAKNYEALISSLFA